MSRLFNVGWSEWREVILELNITIYCKLVFNCILSYNKSSSWRQSVCESENSTLEFGKNALVEQNRDRIHIDCCIRNVDLSQGWHVVQHLKYGCIAWITINWMKGMFRFMQLCIYFVRFSWIFGFSANNARILRLQCPCWPAFLHRRCRFSRAASISEWVVLIAIRRWRHRASRIPWLQTIVQKWIDWFLRPAFLVADS